MQKMASNVNEKCINAIHQEAEQVTAQDGTKDRPPPQRQSWWVIHFFQPIKLFFSVSVAFFRKIYRASLCKLLKEWIKNPMNIALFIWILCVSISGTIMLMLITRMLNGVLPKKSQRDEWLEANIQIINALFTLMSLYHQPKMLYDLVLLIRRRPEDVLKLRKTYCKNGTSKPNEWAHMMVVVVLLHLNSFAQYILFGITVGFTRSKRPAIVLGLLISVAASTAVFAHVYSLLSPLGREYETHNVQKAETGLKSPERTNSSNPRWIGGLFQVKSDASVVCMSVFCSFCVFGWNMERLGMGNMYVHIATFFLFCFAPFFIFNLAAIRIDNEAVREGLVIAGVLLCVFGLMYGGFWRIQMRKRFKLPEYNFFCGSASAADCLQWLCCCSCALAQEVKTANHYDVMEGKFCLKKGRDGENVGVSPVLGVSRSPAAEGDEFLKIAIETLKPPVSPLVSREVGSTP